MKTRRRPGFWLPLVAICSLAYVACAASTLSNRARHRHAAEFGCHESAVYLERVAPRTWVATGCGYRAVYICEQRDCAQDSVHQLAPQPVAARATPIATPPRGSTATITRGPIDAEYVFVRPVPRSGPGSGLREGEFDPPADPP